MMTDLSRFVCRDWQLCRCVLSGGGFRLCPRTSLSLHWAPTSRPWQFEKQVMPASTTSLPAVPTLHILMHRVVTRTMFLTEVKKDIYLIKIKNKEKIWILFCLFITDCYDFNCKAIFLHSCDIFSLFSLTSALFGTCCYKSSVGLLLLSGSNRRRAAIPVFALYMCFCEKCERMFYVWMCAYEC